MSITSGAVWKMQLTTASTGATSVWSGGTSTNNISIPMVWPNGIDVDDDAIFVRQKETKIGPGKRTIELPDGAQLVIDDLGNYHIEDKDAQVQYRANRMREFSPHVNASDMLAAFVRYVGSLGVRQSEVLGLPIELFVNWLIIEAAERDADPVPNGVVPVEAHSGFKSVRFPKCRTCGRFIPRLHQRNAFPFCGVEHGVRFVESRMQAKALPSLTSGVFQ